MDCVLKVMNAVTEMLIYSKDIAKADVINPSTSSNQNEVLCAEENPTSAY